ncbi:hydantoinase B/oxoprolinase family protein [Methylorubrum zatmanii]
MSTPPPAFEGTAELTAVTHEIIQGKLLSAVDEMAIVMARTSMSPVIYEVLDFACGLCRADGALVAQANGITLFTGTFSTQVRALMRRFGDDLAPGDMLVTNDPFSGGTHACDFALVRPIFFDGRVIAFAVNVAHWLDVGGAVPGSLPPDAGSVFQEGLRLPGIRIARGDVLIPEIVRIITENVRMPDLALGDLNAQVATLRVAEKRMLEIVGRYGLPVTQASIDRLLDDSEARARAAIAALPDGTYRATDVIDGDGATDAAIATQVAVTIRGDTMTVDYTGCPAARPGPINCSRGALESAVKTVFKALIAPHEPSNEGWFRPLTVVAEAGTLFTAEKPSPTGWYYEGSVHASELLWKAVAGLVPERMSAGSYTSLCVTYIAGEGGDGRPFVHIEPHHGGWGACRDRDGTSGLIALTDGDTYNYSVEVIETKFPLLVRQYAYNTAGGTGAGRFRGGFGLVRDYEILSDTAQVHCGIGRTRTAPWGMEGGADGSCNGLDLLSPEGGRTALTRSPPRALNRADVVRIRTGGGGGWGPSAERDGAAIAADIADGFLTPDEALRLYGRTGPSDAAPEALHA